MELLRWSLRLCDHYVHHALGDVGGYIVCWLQRRTLLHGWVKCYVKKYKGNTRIYDKYKQYIVYAYVKHLLEHHSDDEIFKLTLHTREEIEKYVKHVEKMYPKIRELNLDILSQL